MDEYEEMLKVIDGEIKCVKERFYRSPYDCGYLEAMEMMKFHLENKKDELNEGMEERYAMPDMSKGNVR